MLVTLKEIMDICEVKKIAAGSFNTPNLESVMAVIGAAEELNLPVIIQHAQVHEEFMPLSVIGPIMVEMAKRARVEVCVHLDHGETIDYIDKALAMGFTSVMYDGSVLPFEENMANTKRVVSLAKQTGASVEAEIGSMGKRETGSGSAGSDDPDKVYTDPKQAGVFVQETGIDALACSFGTTHGVYLKKPKLDFSVVENVRKQVNIPVVMHGGSGVSAEDFRKAIESGVRKINYYTYMALAGGSAVKNMLAEEYAAEDKIMYHDIVSKGVQAMKDDCKQAMAVFALQEV